MTLVPAPRGSRIDLIKQIVVEHFGLCIADMNSHRRSNNLARPRMMAMTLCRDFLKDYTLPLIGRCFGGRDHTTVMHATERVKALRAKLPEINRDFHRLTAKVKRALTASPAGTQAEILADRFAGMAAEEVRSRILAGMLEDPKAFVEALMAPRSAPIDKMHPNDVQLAKAQPARHPPARRPPPRHSGSLMAPMPQRLPTDLHTLAAIRADLKVTAAKLRARAAAKDGSAR